LLLEEDSIGPCGQPHDESMQPAMEGKYHVRQLSCHACAEKSKAQRDLHEGTSDHGIFLIVEPDTHPRGGPS
jgi:hypothetical protein